MRVCPYTYCSLNGHAHAPAVPLRSFLATRRRLIKTQQSMKLKGVSAFRKKPGDKNGGTSGGAVAAAKIAPLIDEEVVGDFFVEVYAGPRVSSDMSCSDMSMDEMDATVRKMEFVVFDRCGADEDSEKGKDLVFCGDGERDVRLDEKHGACRDSSSVCSDTVISSDFIEELPWMRYHGYEYDSLDDGISEEQRVRDDEINHPKISDEKEGNGNEGTSGRQGDECAQKAAEEHEANGEENITNSILESEIAGKQGGVDCRFEDCVELGGKDAGNILDVMCPGESFKGQAEENFSDTVDESEIPDPEVAGMVDSSVIEESCIEETSADQERKDCESSVKSDDGSEIMPDDGSDMEISEDTVSNGCRENFSEEVTAKAAIAEEVCEQHDNNADESTANDIFEQDGSPENTLSDAQKELAIITSKIENGSEGSDIVYSVVDGTKDAQKEMVVTTFEEPGTANESNPDTILCFDDDAETKPKITTCMPKDASVESDVSQGSSLDGNRDFVADGAMGPEIIRCKLEDAYEETGIDQEAVEDDDCAKDSFTTQEAEQSYHYADVSSDTQNESNHTTSELALGMREDTAKESELTTCQPEDVSEESGISQESDRDNCSAYIMDGIQNESELTTFESESAQEDSDVVNEDKGKGNSADSQKLENTACRSGGASEAPAMSREPDGHVNIIDSSDSAPKDISIQKLDVPEDTQAAKEINQLLDVVIPEPKHDCMAEGDVVNEDKGKGNSADSQKLENTACESGGASEAPAMSQEADGHVNIIFSSDSVQEDSDTVNKDEGKGNELVNVDIPEPKHDCMAESDEPERMAAEVTDAKEPSVDDICDAFSGLNLKGEVYFDLDESSTCPRNKLIISRRRRTPEEEEYMRGFNPRAPNFLPLELDPDAEKVDLRHQMVDERKNAEEWMIDYALRRAVTNLAPARKKKVELLVQAFETVLPHDEDDKKNIAPPRPVQACN